MRKLCPLFALALIASACPQPQPAPAPHDDHEAPAVTNRIDTPPVVRENLGITFVGVERRHVAQTLRVPGRFEAAPEAMLEVRAPLAGRVNLRVQQYQRVADGAVLFKLESPAWLAEQQAIAQADLAAARAAMQVGARTTEKGLADRGKELAAARLAAIAAQEAALNARESELAGLRSLWEARVADLEQLAAQGAARGTDVFEARVNLAQARADLAEQREKRAQAGRDRADVAAEAEQAAGAVTVAELELKQAQAEAEAAALAFEAALGRAVVMTGLDAEELKKAAAGVPLWRSLGTLEVRAPFAGIVGEVKLSSRALAGEGDAVLTLLDTSRLRVRAKALQADLLKLADGQSARILAPTGGDLALAPSVEATLSPALEADADERVIDLVVTPRAAAAWARPGVACEVEITLKTTEQPQLAVPMASVVRDELDLVLFRRDPRNPDKVIRETPEFGPNDGRWIVVKTAIGPEDEVVLNGVYELKLTGSGKAMGVGHFHADGTWHAGAEHD